MALTKKERKQLSGTAHHLKPIINAGKEGLTDQFIASVEEALTNRELIKVKFLDGSGLDPKKAGAEICEKIDAELVGAIGFVAIIYRYAESVKKHALIDDSIEE